LRVVLYDLLADRSPAGWRAEHVVDLSEVRHFGLYHVNGKLGDTVYLALLAIEALRTPGRSLTVFTSEGLVSYWKFVCPDARVIVLDAKPLISSKGLNPGRWRALRALSGTIDCLITLDSGDSLEALMDFRVLRPVHLMAGGKEHYRLFDLTFAEHFYTTAKTPVINKVRSALQVLGAQYIGPARVLVAPSAGRVFFNTFGASSSRVFSLPFVAQAVYHLNTVWGISGHRLVVSVPAAQAAECRETMARLGAQAELLDVVDSGELARVVSGCSACITPDTGVAHLAASLGVPTLVMFAASNYHPVAWLPDFPWVLADVPAHDRDLHDMTLSEFAVRVHGLMGGNMSGVFFELPVKRHIENDGMVVNPTHERIAHD